MPTVWTINRVEGEERLRTMAFIRDQFAEHFDAQVCDDTEEVYAVQRPGGEIDAAFGLSRNPSQFFCRHYVGDVATQVARREGPLAQNASMVELAHLCVRHPATLCRIMPQLAAFLASRADYLVCTVTCELANFFRRKGLAPQSLGPARASKLPTTVQGGWGSYYEHLPEVVMGNLTNACERLGIKPAPNCAQRHLYPTELLQIA